MNDSILNRIKTPNELVEQQGAKLLVYGESGAGKTTLCKTAPGKTLVVSMESGLLSIKDAPNLDAIEVKEASEIEQIAELLENKTLDYDTVCLDSVTEMAEILLSQEKAKSKDPRRAYGEVIEVMIKTMRRFRDLPMHVVFIAKQSRERDEGKTVTSRWLQTKIGQNYIAKDRSGKLEGFESPDLATIINKLGFAGGAA